MVYHPPSTQEHMNVHTGATPITCEVPGCGHQTATVDRMRTHTAKHTSRRGGNGTSTEIR